MTGLPSPARRRHCSGGSRNPRSMQPPTRKESGRPQPLGFVRGSPGSRRPARAVCHRCVDAGSGVHGDEGLSSEAVAPNPDPMRRGAGGWPVVCRCSADLGRGPRGARGAVPEVVLKRRSPWRPPPLPGRAGGGSELPGEGRRTRGSHPQGARRRGAYGQGLSREPAPAEEVAAQQQRARVRSTNLLEAAAPPRPTRAPGTEILARVSFPLPALLRGDAPSCLG